jgi:predicted proteasome-type protease
MVLSGNDSIKSQWTLLFTAAETNYLSLEKKSLDYMSTLHNLANFAFKNDDVFFKRNGGARNACEAVISKLHPKRQNQSDKQHRNNISQNVSRLVEAVKELIPKNSNHKYFFYTLIVNS